MEIFTFIFIQGMDISNRRNDSGSKENHKCKITLLIIKNLVSLCL